MSAEVHVSDKSLLKYLIRDKREHVVHSSGYATVQNGSSMGATSTESFEHRMMVEKNRKRVGKYNSSRIAAQARVVRPMAKTYTPPDRSGAVGGGAGGSAMRGGARPLPPKK